MLKPSHAAGTKDLTINPSVSPRSTSDNSVARRLRPVNRLSMPRTVIPAKKHHVAREGFFGSRLAKARSRAKIAAAKGRYEEMVTVSSAGQVQTPLLAPQPPQQQKLGDQGQREEEGAAPVVNGAVDHVGPHIYAKRSEEHTSELQSPCNL